MKTKWDVEFPELSDGDKNFAKTLAKDFEIPLERIESYISELRYEIKKAFKSIDVIDSIDYSGEKSSIESKHLKWLSHFVLGFIYERWEIRIYHKTIIAGLILKHYKLDKYERILTKNEFIKALRYSAQDYNHYLYDRIKSRFKTFKKPQKLF